MIGKKYEVYNNFKSLSKALSSFFFLRDYQIEALRHDLEDAQHEKERVMDEVFLNFFFVICETQGFD